MASHHLLKIQTHVTHDGFIQTMASYKPLHPPLHRRAGAAGAPVWHEGRLSPRACPEPCPELDSGLIQESAYLASFRCIGGFVPSKVCVP
jgi:hypothetical protein